MNKLKTIKTEPIKIEPLIKDIISHRNSLSKEIAKVDGLIGNRITYIAEFVCNAFEQKLDCWYFSDAENFSEAVKGDRITLSMYAKNRTDYICNVILLKDGTEWQLDEIPLRWLTEDFEDEVVEGRLKYIKYLETKKQETKERLLKEKADKEKVLQEIKNKLTPEEFGLIKDKI